MQLKRNQGRVVHAPLSFVFQMLEMGGSLLQKYDASTAAFIPNRLLTPLVLQPQLIISDPDGTIATADYAAQMSNVTWTLTSTTGGTTTTIPATTPGGDTFYVVDNATKRITIYYNVQPQEHVHVRFYGKYTDQRRGEVYDIEWERDLGCEAQTDLNVTLDVGRWKNKVLLMPMRNWGQFGIPVQLKNGPDAIPDNRATYLWQWCEPGDSSWKTNITSQPWCVSGYDTKEIVVDQDFIQDIILRVKAVAYGNNNAPLYFVTRLKRWYGQFDYDVEFLRGKYIFHDTNTVVLNAWVANARGIISSPCKYFDMELFFAIGNGDFESIGYGEEAVITRSGLQDGQPQCGILCRELSAYRAICGDDGKPICMDDGTLIFAQFPTKSRDVGTKGIYEPPVGDLGN